MQNDFVEGGALAVTHGLEIVPIINRLQPLFELVVATQDWHPLEHCSFAINHPGKKPGDVIESNGVPQMLWPVHCVEGSTGAAFVPGLNTSRVKRIFHKGTDPLIDSYSGFFDNGHRNATGLADFLKRCGIKEIYIAGVATDYCVKFTAIDGVHLGFKTHVLQDTCRGVNLNPGDVERAVADMKDAGVELLSSG
jgi:nicotinamidase/pyrazinamidase